MNNTDQLLDRIIELFDEIDENDKEDATVALISVIARKSGEPRNIFTKAWGEVCKTSIFSYRYRSEKSYEELVN